MENSGTATHFGPADAGPDAQAIRLSGFVAGTLVHAKDGILPIEQIKVGDWVLSRPPDRGENACKRVLRTFTGPNPDTACPRNQGTRSVIFRIHATDGAITSSRSPPSA